MPLTPKGRKIEANMEKEYGPEKGKHVFYASKNKGTISGVEEKKKHMAHKILGLSRRQWRDEGRPKAHF